MRGTLVFITLFALGSLGATPARADDGADLKALIAGYQERELAFSPSQAIAMGDERYLDRYERNLEPDDLAARRKANAQSLRELAGISRSALSAQEQLDYDIFAWTLKDDARLLAPGIAEMQQMMPLNSYNGAHLAFAREMQWRAQYPFAHAADYEKTIARMNGFARWLDQAQMQMRAGLKAGIVLPRVETLRLIAELDDVIHAPPETSPLMAPSRSLDNNIAAADRARLQSLWRDTVMATVLPSYVRLRTFLFTDYLPKCRTSIGLSDIPRGRELYRVLVLHHASVNASTEAMTHMGENAWRSISTAMNHIKDANGFAGSLTRYLIYMRDDPRRHFATPAQMKDAFDRAETTARKNISLLFARVPKAPLEFRFFDEVSGKVKSAAEYTPPTDNDRRPGIVWINADEIGLRPTYTVDALELHEGIPGHHLQLAGALENTELSPFRRSLSNSAFVEGWGLYAETLGADLGLYQTDDQKFGALALQAWRAARLVVDNGIHMQGWGRDEAIRYLLDHSALSRNEAETEVDRYIAWPAQAVSYWLGLTEFQNMRTKAEAALGAKFDIKRFHVAILDDGAMPFPVLDAKMARWIESERTR